MSDRRKDSETEPRQRYRKSGPDQERNRLSGRARRYAQVGGAVGGLAARLAGTRLGFDLDKVKHSSELREALGGVRGPLMKVAQILATIPDALPEEYAGELRQLQSNAPPMGWPFVKRRMATELGPNWQKEFDSFEHEAAAAASLGQVHRAWDHDGRELACKLQYPDMQSTVEADLKQLNWALQIYRRYDSAIDTSDIYKELSARLREELDYDLEGRHMAIYGDMLSEEPGVHVPEWVAELSTDRLLTMTWLEGTPIWDYIDKHLSDKQDKQGKKAKKSQDTKLRNEVAYNMFRAWYVPFYYYGVIHGDPHLGNYSVVEDDRSINLLDFGCIRTFQPKFVKGVIDLYFALEREDWDLAAEAYKQWGFDNLNREMLEVLNMWAQFLYAPLLEDSVRPIQEGQSGQYGAQVASKVHRELKRLGGVKPPREFVLMDRAAIGLGSVFMRLKAEINWHRLFHELIGDFDVDKLAERQKNVLDRHGVPHPT
ncbi:MAG: AarF/UbiB family protein [Rhodovibrionaceae bacterium]|nr:AarF/UbiB family protein [Rhodovibrionaceae bacterium]